MKKVLIWFLLIALIVSIFMFLWNFISYPEIYISTWKYQLEQDIKSGDVEAIKYYQTRYVSKGIDLYGGDI